MSEVSCMVLRFIVDGACQQGLREDELLAGLPLTPSQLRRRGGRVAWDVYVEILERIEELSGDPDELERLAYEHQQSRTFEFIGKVARYLVRARDIYWMGVVWLGRAFFTIVRDSFEELPDGRIRVVLEIPPEYRDSPQFFRTMLGAIRAAPHHFGQADTPVHMELAPRRAAYLITPPPALGFWTRLRRRAKAIFGAQRAIQELSAQQAQLQQSYAELNTASRTILRQTTHLKRVNRLARKLISQVDLDEVSAAVLDLLQSRLQVDGLSLWILDARTHEPALVRKLGRTQGGHRDSYPLQTAGRIVGRLDVWDSKPEQDPQASELLGELLPWIAIALGNARSFASLNEHARVLEQRIEASTADPGSGETPASYGHGADSGGNLLLSSSEERLLDSERLTLMGSLAAGIAHEINNPVGSILANAEYGLSHGDGPDAAVTQRRALEQIIEYAKRCGRIVKSVLQFARGEPSEKWPEDLNRIAERAVDLTREYAATRSYKLELDLCSDPLLVCVNPLQIEQVIVNLLRNAIEAQPARSAQIELRTRRAGSHNRLSVSDQGPGIPREDLPHIFEPFYTARHVHGGSGLGLSIVHGILREHGGEIVIDSTLYKGTTVTVELPATESGEPRPAADGSVNPSADAL